MRQTGQRGIAAGHYDRGMTSEFPQFPPGFAWGVATSAYQIEGAVAEDGRTDSVWDTFCRRPGVVRDGHTGDVAADHYHRWRQDVALLSELGINAYRFSISWPRVQPGGTGPANGPGLDFYDRLTDALLAAGIKPVPTLFHWDLPQELEDAGGWLSRDTAARFADYAGLACQRLADRIETWSTINAPFVLMTYGYALGVHAPGRALLLDALPAGHHMLLGHGLAANALRAAGARQIAILNNYSPIWPASPSAADTDAAWALDTLQNRAFTDPVLLGSYPDLSVLGPGPGELRFVRDGDLNVIAAPIDLLGVDYYMPTRVSAAPGARVSFHLEPIEGYPVTASGWPVVPAGLTEVLTMLHDRYPGHLPPLLITENGCSQPDQPEPDGSIDDQARISYLDGHIRAVADALKAGVDVRGYLAWTLLDNFEWDEGYHQRFGLVHVDFATQQRTPKASYFWYRNMIAAQPPLWAASRRGPVSNAATAAE